MIELYGIANCDKVRQALKFLKSSEISFVFHDFKKEGLALETLQNWLEHHPIKNLVNQRSTSWRALNEAEKQGLLNLTQLEIILNTPTLIKRPILVTNKQILVGFKPADYEKTLISHS